MFSYHGIPAAYVEEGDPYQAQAEATTRSVVARLGLAAERMVALLPVAIRQGGLAAALHGRHVEGSGRARRAQGDGGVAVVRGRLSGNAGGSGDRIPRQDSSQFGGERLTLVPALNDDDRHAEVLASIGDPQSNQRVDWISIVKLIMHIVYNIIDN